MKTLKKETAVHNLLDEMRHGFHEGASLRKYKNTYILLYTCILRGKATCLAHATSLHPLGPYTYRGIVIDNIGVDPQTWNNHGSIECFNGKWYVFYHRSSQNSCFSRRLCIEPIEISDDGFIKEVLPTSQGTQPPFPAEYELDASHACRLGG
ncbi:MAG: family 43 glycosylhydrolase, partial [Clostridia bacterium]|nr:family 43 glycosylhydrolase [Clostridia bacterium]